MPGSAAARTRWGHDKVAAKQITAMAVRCMPPPYSAGDSFQTRRFRAL